MISNSVDVFHLLHLLTLFIFFHAPSSFHFNFTVILLPVLVSLFFLLFLLLLFHYPFSSSLSSLFAYFIIKVDYCSFIRVFCFYNTSVLIPLHFLLLLRSPVIDFYPVIYPLAPSLPLPLQPKPETRDRKTMKRRRIVRTVTFTIS